MVLESGGSLGPNGPYGPIALMRTLGPEKEGLAQGQQLGQDSSQIGIQCLCVPLAITGTAQSYCGLVLDHRKSTTVIKLVKGPFVKMQHLGRAIKRSTVK